MRVLLTGSSGFVGSHAAFALEQAGHALRLSARLSSSTRFLTSLGPHEQVALDLFDPEQADAACSGVEAVVHAAGLTRAASEADFFRVNAEGTRALAQAALRQGVRRFVFVSSLEARGPDQLMHPDSPYGASKQLAERYLREVDGLEVVVLRPAGVYGPRDRDLLALFQLARLGVLPRPASGHPLQPVYAEDVSSAIVRALHGPTAFGPFALAEAATYPWEVVRGHMERALGRRIRLATLPDRLYTGAGAGVERLAKLLGRAPPLDARRGRALSIYSYTCDPRPAEAALGWTAQVPLAEGLIRTAQWYRAQGWLR